MVDLGLNYFALSVDNQNQLDNSILSNHYFRYNMHLR